MTDGLQMPISLRFRRTLGRLKPQREWNHPHQGQGYRRVVTSILAMFGSRFPLLPKSPIESSSCFLSQYPDALKEQNQHLAMMYTNVNPRIMPRLFTAATRGVSIDVVQLPVKPGFREFYQQQM